MKFILEIELGNERMQSGRDIADALREVAGRISNYSPGTLEKAPPSGRIMDENGNSVGKWEVVDAD